MTLLSAQEGKEYIIQSVQTDDKELIAFLFSLGCYSGQSISAVSCLKKNCIVSLKGVRYSIDNHLANSIIIE